jgi:hypothetical protein
MSSADTTAVGANTAWMDGTKVYEGFRDPAAAYADMAASAYAAAAVPGVASSAGGSSHRSHAGHDSVHAWSVPIQEHAVAPATRVQRNRITANHGAVSLADVTSDESRTEGPAAEGPAWMGGAAGADPVALIALLEAEFLSELSTAQLTVLKEERDLLAEQHKSLLQLLADSSVTQPGS